MSKKIRIIAAICCIFTLLLSGCANKEAKQNGKPIVYASFYPIYDMVKDVVGDTVDLRTFMPIDKDPHMWEPTPKDMKELKDADLLIVNGANMEKWLDSVRKSLPKLNILVLSDSVELITYKGAAAVGDFQYMAEQKAKKGEKYKIDFGHTHEDVMRVTFIDNSKNLSKEELVKKGKEYMNEKGKLVPQKSTINVKDGQVYAIEMGHEHGEVTYKFPKSGNWVFISDRISEDILPYDLMDKKGDIIKPKVLLAGNTSGLDKITYDPHSWISVINAKKYLNAIYDDLSKRYTDNKSLYYKNKVKAIDKLTDLDVEYREKFKKAKNNQFVVTHYAYAYLARDFGLKQFPLQELISTETPSLKTIKKAIDYCNYHKINTIFYEAGMEKKGADTLAEEIHGKAVPLTSMEYMNSNINKNESFVDIMRDNLEKLYKSMDR